MRHVLLWLLVAECWLGLEELLILLFTPVITLWLLAKIRLFRF